MQATSGISQLDWEMEYQQKRRAGIEFYLRCIREGDVDGNHGGCCAECGRVNSLNIQKIRFPVIFFISVNYWRNLNVSIAAVPDIGFPEMLALDQSITPIA
jgi:hypothetical protein